MITCRLRANWEIQGLGHFLKKSQTSGKNSPSVCVWNRSAELFTREATRMNNKRVLSFVSRCGHLKCDSWRFDCTLLVFIRRWGRLVSDLLIKQDAPPWLVGFFFSREWRVSILDVSELFPRRESKKYSQVCGEVADHPRQWGMSLIFSIVGKLWDVRGTVRSPIVHENQAQRTLFASVIVCKGKGMKVSLMIHSFKKRNSIDI